MADLNGNAPKTFYQRLTQFASGVVSGTLQTIQDGRGNNSALQVSVSEVRSTGKISAAGDIEAGGSVKASALTASTDSSLPVVVLNGSNEFQTRLSGYDSGWKDMPELSGSVGVFDYTNFTAPQVRAIGRVIFFRGHYPIGLDDSGHVTDWNNVYPSDSTTVETTDSGISIVSNEIVLPNFLADTIQFQETKFPLSERLIRKSYYANNGGVAQTDNSMYYRTKVQPVLNASGSMTIKSINTAYNTASHGTGAYSTNASDLVRGVSRVTAGQRVYDYSGFENSFDSTGSTDQAAVAADASKYHYLTFDGLDANDFGGSELLLDGLFGIVDDTVSESTIKTIFDAL